MTRILLIILYLLVLATLCVCQTLVAEPQDGYYHLVLGYQYLTAPTERNEPVRLITEPQGPLSEWLLMKDDEEGGFVLANANTGLYLSYDYALPYAYLRVQSEPALWNIRKVEEDDNDQCDEWEKDEDISRKKINSHLMEIVTKEKYKGQHLVVGRHPVRDFPRYVGLLLPSSDRGEKDAHSWKLKRLGGEEEEEDETKHAFGQQLTLKSPLASWFFR